MADLDSLVYSSAVLCLSPTTEYARNKAIDTTIIHNIASEGIKQVFLVKTIYESLRKDVRLRYEEIEKSVVRCIKNRSFEITKGTLDKIDSVKFRLSSELISRLETQTEKIQKFLGDAVIELFEDVCANGRKGKIETLLLLSLSKLMAKYGYVYAGQITGFMKTEDLIPKETLHKICQQSCEVVNVPEISAERLAEAIGVLFDKKDPCFSNLVFNLCQKYYISRLMGMDLPLDFLSRQLYEGATVFLDTNALDVAFSKSSRHNELKSLLAFAPKLGITFAVLDLTVAEAQKRVEKYRVLLEKAEKVMPSELIEEVEENILETSHESDLAEIQQITIKSKTAKNLEQIGIKVIPLEENNVASDKILEKAMSELKEFDKKYRKMRPPKDKNALYHDAQLYHRVSKLRKETGKPTVAWFLTVDNSVIAHGVYKKEEGKPPYSIKLPTLLHTLSPFIESSVLKGDFEDLFVNLISKDLLPKDRLFNIDDLKMFVGFDIKAKSMPPEIIRKAMYHVKKEVLKGGGLTDDNKALVVQEFTKFLTTPEICYADVRSTYEKKLRLRDEEIDHQTQEINVLKQEKAQSDENYKGQIKELQNVCNTKDQKTNIAIVTAVTILLSLILWFSYLYFNNYLMRNFANPILLFCGIQAMVTAISLSIIIPKKKLIVLVITAFAELIFLIASLKK